VLIEITEANYETEVVKTQGFVLADFWSTSCQHCKALMPFVDSLAETYQDALKIVKVERSANRDLFIKKMVMTLPTFILFKDGQEVKRTAGKSIEEDDIIDFIGQYLEA
jgi:thioredoxin 1